MPKLNLDSMSGNKLDEYGKSVGIPRYQGMGMPETDAEYRKSIRLWCPESKKAIVEVPGGVGKELKHDKETMYVIMYSDSSTGEERICCHKDYQPAGLGLFVLESDALDELAKWKGNGSRSGKFEIKKIRCFEMIE